MRNSTQGDTKAYTGRHATHLESELNLFTMRVRSSKDDTVPSMRSIFRCSRRYSTVCTQSSIVMVWEKINVRWPSSAHETHPMNDSNETVMPGHAAVTTAAVDTHP